jgi:hypothetical protein
MESFGRSAAIPNPALKAFEILIGEWRWQGSHPMLPGVTLNGRASFEWFEGGAFLMMHSSNEEGKIPTAVALFGSDDSMGELYMLYFDERKVSRKQDVSFDGNILRWWRNDPKFSQRNTLTFSSDRKTIITRGEMLKEGGNWEDDLSMTYRKI